MLKFKTKLILKYFNLDLNYSIFNKVLSNNVEILSCYVSRKLLNDKYFINSWEIQNKPGVPVPDRPVALNLLFIHQKVRNKITPNQCIFSNSARNFHLDSSRLSSDPTHWPNNRLLHAGWKDYHTLTVQQHCEKYVPRYRFYCNNAYRSSSSSYGRSVPLTVEEIQDTLNQKTDSPPDAKLLKIAIIGVPNAGKSTLINKLVGWRVCSVSQKVHTTVCNARAVHNYGETQLVFLDTPGAVTLEEAKKYRLKQSLVLDPEISLQQADLIAVLHDVSNKYTRNILHPRILRLLSLYPTIPSVLILNKVDLLKSKEILLTLTEKLTEGKVGNQVIKRSLDRTPLKDKELKEMLLKDIFLVEDEKHDKAERDNVKFIKISKKEPDDDKQEPYTIQSTRNYSYIGETANEDKQEPFAIQSTRNYSYIGETAKDSSTIFEKDPINVNFSEEDVLSGKIKLTELQAKHFLEGKKGWSNFKHVFMVSSLEGTGIDSVKKYLIEVAKPNPWIFSDDVITDQSPQEIALLTVREKCLEHLKSNIPYELNFQILYWNLSEADVLNIIVGAYCRNKHHMKLLIGPSGAKVRLISSEAEQDLRNTFRTDVRLKINFEHNANLKEKFA